MHDCAVISADTIRPYLQERFLERDLQIRDDICLSRAIPARGTYAFSLSSIAKTWKTCLSFRYLRAHCLGPIACRTQHSSVPVLLRSIGERGPRRPLRATEPIIVMSSLPSMSSKDLSLSRLQARNSHIASIYIAHPLLVMSAI